MKRILTTLLPTLTLLLLFGSCKSTPSASKEVLQKETDSVAYILGLNIATNLLEMDSTLNIEALVAGMRDRFARAELFDKEEAQRIYLHYFHISKPEEVLAYENQFLEEFARDNRNYARSKTGLTYAVEEVGDVDHTPKNGSDTLTLRLVGRTLDGREFFSSYERGDTLRTSLQSLPEGLQEGLKLIGKGGRLTAYLPAALAYGAEGCDSLGVGANATVYYEAELIDLERHAFSSRRRL